MLDGGRREVRFGLVEAADVDRDGLVEDAGKITASERANTARLAKEVVRELRVELVVGEVVLAGEEAKAFRLHDRTPVRGLVANGAVALARALSQVDVRFVANRAAV